MTLTHRLAALGLALGMGALGACTTPSHGVSSLQAASTPGEKGAVTCDRRCLAGVMTDYLSALAAGDSSRLKLAEPVRFTEDQEEKRFGVEGLWASKVVLTGYRFDILDVR
jgi:hypothetical protein